MKRVFEYKIPKEYDGKTIKDFLYNACGMSGTFIKELKKTDDGIVLNGERKFVIEKLHENDTLIVSAHDKVSETIAPVKLDFTVVYEDDDLIIVDKPPHMPTHPSPGNYDNTLANGLMYYWQQKGENHVFRAVNRLDKDTSGLMCVAKNSHSNALLCEALKNGDVRRKYMAIVCGSVEKDGTVDAPIGREGVIKRCIRADGDYAVTHYRVIERLEGYTLLELQLETGRTHQIRVHMSHIGNPLLGDWLYGVEDKVLFNRHALHSCYLELVHPISGKLLKFRSDLPQDMQCFVKK